MKNKILLLVFVLISFSSLAQNNWSQISSSLIVRTSNNEDYTWLLYSTKVVRMNNTTKLLEEFKLPSNLNDLPYLIVSYKDELWAVSQSGSSAIFHLKNGVWTKYSDPEFGFIMNAGINEIDGTAVFGDPDNNQIVIIKNKNMKVIKIPFIDDFSNFCMPNSNSIVFYSRNNTALYEIDTLGNVRNKFTYNRIGATGSFLGYLQQDKNQNIYFLIQGDGFYKIKFAQNDTSIQKLINTTLSQSNSIETFKVDHNDDLVIKKYDSNDILYSIFDSQGNLIKTYGLINGTFGINYTFVGFDNNNNPLSILNSKEIWKVDEWDWNLIYSPKNLYDGNRIEMANIGSTSKLIFGGINSLYTLNNDSVIKCSFDSTFKNLLNITGISNINNEEQYLCVSNEGVLKIAKCTNSKVNFEEIVPNSAGNLPQNDNTNLIITNDNKLLVLLKDRIKVYHGKNNPWTTINFNPVDNISEIYSFCKDDNNNVWVGTNKGVAKIINNFIVLQTQINKKNEVHDITYNKNENCLVFSNNSSSINSVCLYYLNSQNLITINTNYPTRKILIDQNNDYAYFQYDFDKIWRYDISNIMLDIDFNSSITNTPFNTIYPSHYEIDRDNKIYIFKRNTLAGDFFIEIFDEKAFVSATYERNKFISFYPNPTLGIINLDSKQNFTKYFVYNTKGETLKFGEIKNNKIDILELIPGVYTLKIIGVNGESFRKIIKN